MPGWAPAYGEDRRKDYSRAAGRARALRKNETPHEKRLWKLLRELNRDGANFRRQANVGHKVFDFADLGRKILIELDGAVHDHPDVREADKQKEIDAILRGYRVVRITNEELRANAGAVVERIKALVARSSPQRGEGREVGRSTKRFLSRLDADNASGGSADSPARPLPLPPPPGAGEESDA
jgi:very-short-patch-repair endonuclease